MSKRDSLSLVVAARLGSVGGLIGVVAGITQATIGSRISDWSGNKGSPVALGLLTIILSMMVIGAARSLRVEPTARPGQFVGVALWFVVVAGLCSTTVGRLWVVPEVLIFVAAGFTVAACGLDEFKRVIATHWLRGLLGVLGGFEWLMAVSAGPTLTIAFGIVAGCALVAAAILGAPGKRTTMGLFLAASLPFAIVSWWSLISPLVSITAIVIGFTITSGVDPRIVLAAEANGAANQG